MDTKMGSVRGMSCLSAGEGEPATMLFGMEVQADNVCAEHMDEKTIGCSVGEWWVRKPSVFIQNELFLGVVL